MEFIQTSGRSTLSALRDEMDAYSNLCSHRYYSIVHTAKDLRIIQKYVSGPQRPACREQSEPAGVLGVLGVLEVLGVLAVLGL